MSSFISLLLIASFPAQDTAILAWDGAGSTWTCDVCGTTNYDWQCSCYNCGKWR